MIHGSFWNRSEQKVSDANLGSCQVSMMELSMLDRVLNMPLSLSPITELCPKFRRISLFFNREEPRNYRFAFIYQKIYLCNVAIFSRPYLLTF